MTVPPLAWGKNTTEGSVGYASDHVCCEGVYIEKLTCLAHLLERSAQLVVVVIVQIQIERGC